MRTHAETIRKAALLAAPGGWDPAARRRAFLSLCLWPALIVLALALIYPLFYNVALSFSDAGPGQARDWHFAGARQYTLVFREPVFWMTFARTVVWTVACTAAQVALGVALALALHQEFVRERAAWRILLLLPWAVPQYVAALSWRGMFTGERGAVNALLSLSGMAPLDWLGAPSTAFTAMILVNIWMGFPFMMLIASTGLRAIPDSVYEAARLEGASRRDIFTRLTAPLLRPLMLPATTLGIVWNFNSLNLVWLFTDGGKPADSTHILCSYVYKTAFGESLYAWSAALSVVIFVIFFLAVQGFLQAGRLRRR